MVQKGAQKSAKRAERTTGEGVVGSYIHANKKIGAMVILKSETDFVARNEEFVELARDLAMHIAAASPKYLSIEEVDVTELEKEKDIYRVQLQKENKPADIIEKIIEGRIGKFYEEVCLLEQPFIKNDEKKVKELLNDIVGKMGEKIIIDKFIRFQI